VRDSLCEGPAWSKRTGDGTEQLIENQWACGRKALVGQSFALLPDVIKPVLDLFLEVGRLRFLYYNSGF